MNETTLYDMSIQERDVPNVALRNNYIVVRVIVNCIEIFKVKAETANTAIIMVKNQSEQPLIQYYSDEDQYGEGLFAIRIKSQKHEKELHDCLDSLFHAKRNLVIGDMICH